MTAANSCPVQAARKAGRARGWRLSSPPRSQASLSVKQRRPILLYCHAGASEIRSRVRGLTLRDCASENGSNGSGRPPSVRGTTSAVRFALPRSFPSNSYSQPARGGSGRLLFQYRDRMHASASGHLRQLSSSACGDGALRTPIIPYGTAELGALRHSDFALIVEGESDS